MLNQKKLQFVKVEVKDMSKKNQDPDNLSIPVPV